MSNLVKLGLVFGVICFVLLVPFIFIWAVNELSEQGGLSFELPYNFWTWLSTLAIATVLRGGK